MYSLYWQLWKFSELCGVCCSSMSAKLSRQLDSFPQPWSAFKSDLGWLLLVQPQHFGVVYCHTKEREGWLPLLCCLFASRECIWCPFMKLSPQTAALFLVEEEGWSLRFVASFCF